MFTKVELLNIVKYTGHYVYVVFVIGQNKISVCEVHVTSLLAFAVEIYYVYCKVYLSNYC